MARPMIGITTGTTILKNTGEGLTSNTFNGAPEAYGHCVEDAGGTPILLPTLKYNNQALALDWLDRIDGLMLSGGADFNPILTGGEPEPELERIDPERDRVELELTRAAFDRDMPILGICRGIQTIAVALGGSIHQDIKDLEGILKHSQNAPRWCATHTVKLEEKSTVAAILGEIKLEVNTFHHQVVYEPPTGFIITGRSPDGIIEAIEHPGKHFVLGVQWHPENMTGHYEHARRLFEGFVKAVIHKMS
ncbi:MAG: gamma-glutamyl-gamma-aminobutyrate hydrolase family protein [Planctomycetota bacterium]|nr:MAG: gamma-glutamyl-gamma-aminobutyrate hydrolase family protein [Planctomycetota bacterium]